MDHLTFTQQFFMALAHGGPPTIAAFLAYLGLKKKYERKHEEIRILLNGGLEKKIKAVLQDIINESSR